MHSVTEFSGGYFSTELRAEEYAEGPAVAQQFYKYISEKLYDHAPVEPWLTEGSVGEPYFRIKSEAAMPADVIGLPEEIMDHLDISDVYEPRLFLIVKPSFAAFLCKHIDVTSRLSEE